MYHFITLLGWEKAILPHLGSFRRLFDAFRYLRVTVPMPLIPVYLDQFPA
jgi:hypothetical protein